MIDVLKNHPFFAHKQIESYQLLQNQGHCNENYLLVADGVKYIVRKLLRDDIDRAFEWKVHALVYEQGLTAKPLVFDSQNSFMVFAFLEGEHKSTLGEDALKLLAHAVQKLHSIKIDEKPITLKIEYKSEVVLQAFETIETASKEYVLCHNDLNPQNIFFSNEVKLIDFEYAGVNDRYFDLASVCVEFNLEGELEALFLEIYFEGKGFSVVKLKAYKIIYKRLWEEWFEHNS